MLDAICYLFICSLGFFLSNLFCFFVIYGIVFVLNLFYSVFTGKNLKLYEKFSSCFDSEDYLIPFLFSIICIIWLIKKFLLDEPQDDWNFDVQKEPVKQKNKTYEELLTKQEWYDFRKKVIYDRGGYVCEYCKKKHNLQIHHKLYYKKPDKEKIEPWLYNMDEVLLLCDNCHKSIHKKNRIKVYYISYADYDKRKVGFYNQN